MVWIMVKNKNKNQSLKLWQIVFLGFGLVLLIGALGYGLFANNSTDNKAHTEKTTLDKNVQSLSAAQRGSLLLQAVSEAVEQEDYNWFDQNIKQSDQIYVTQDKKDQFVFKTGMPEQILLKVYSSGNRDNLKVKVDGQIVKVSMNQAYKQYYQNKTHREYTNQLASIISPSSDRES